MPGKQVAAYLACFVVFLSCVTAAYDALFSSSPAAPEDASEGLANIAPLLQSAARQATVTPSVVAPSDQDDVPVPSDRAAVREASRPAEQHDIPEAPFATIGKAEPQSDESSPSRAAETLTSADQGREENAGEGRRTRFQVRAAHRGQYYSYRQRNADENNFFGRERYDTYARRDYAYGQRDQYHDKYAWRDSGAFFRADHGRDRKNSGSRQSRGVFGTFLWH